ncbi:MAG: hypothetical protein KC917_13355, partial [Candidatus Omnitrophica bacterium]|nr:hypothetical protein [Candidatus Omnitrophota bacterium]
MNSDNSLRKHTKSPFLLSLILFLSSLQGDARGSDSTDLVSLDPSEVLSKLDLSRPGLETVQKA